MYILLSPAKSIDVRPIRVPVAVSVPAYLEEAEYLVRKLRKMGKRKLGEMMKVSPAIASLNVDRFANWQAPFTAENAHPAVASFQGEVYRGLAASELVGGFAYHGRHVRRPRRLAAAVLCAGTATSTAAGASGGPL
mgnify:CR=1 FL=1